MTIVPRAGPRSTSSALMTSSLYQAEKSSLCGVTPRPSSLTPSRLFQRAADQNQIIPLPNGPWLRLPPSPPSRPARHTPEAPALEQIDFRMTGLLQSPGERNDLWGGI